MTGELDLYAVLGVPPDASPADIGRAYRQLVRRHHPDSHADPSAAAGATDGPASVLTDAEALEQVLAAYAVLRDPERRAEYDKRRRPIRAPRAEPRVRSYSVPSAEDEPPIRFGPVRYHGPPR